MPSATSPLHALALLWLLFVAYSFLGWVVESAYCSVSARRLVNRGFLNGPYIPIYGAGALIAILLLDELPDDLLVFVAGGALSCALEYVTSAVMERIYHARWWDYSDKPLNLDGRVWAGGFVEFGLCMLIVVRVLQPVALCALGSLGEGVLLALVVLTAGVMLADLVVTHLGITRLRGKMDDLRSDVTERLALLREALPDRPELTLVTTWDDLVFRPVRRQLEARLRNGARHLRGAKREIMGALGERGGVEGLSLPPSLDEAAQHFTARLSSQERRLLRAFPRMRPSHWKDSLAEHVRRLRDAQTPRPPR
ncbi:putative ABC transporter permease [Olsenella sp. HMSC062G07]|uniref:putative ABC transporter permease n=1 Tax=Olsenella sp. HMSC062G07 TaxID=1739330 RepID=UPI0008A5A9FD|nr:putative ABC transporter permease [Olsenella sp. HMSC062G07]OFK22372.1 hypothetical protein HMPREF2826_01805 [Olsenella sp. HMSC062G07]